MLATSAHRTSMLSSLFSTGGRVGYSALAVGEASTLPRFPMTHASWLANERRRHALTTGGTRSGKADNACNEHGHDLLWLLLHHAESVPVRVDEDDEVGVVR